MRTQRVLSSVLIVCLLMAGPAVAQDVTDLTFDDKVAGCHRPESVFTVAEWRTLSAESQQKWCAAAALSTPTPSRQPGFPAQTRMRSPKLALVGGLTMLAGLIVALPKGEPYHILDEDFCVTGNRVDYGDCSPEKNTVLTGLAIAGAGGALLAIGVSKVRVAPSVVGPRKGVSATVRW